MPAPNGYRQSQGWYWPTAPEIMFPDSSVYSTDADGGWKLAKPKVYKEKFNATVQGWKVHVCVRADAIRSLFVALSSELQKMHCMHKFAVFENYEQNPETGKACVVYPKDPGNLSMIVRRIEHVLNNIAAIEARGNKAREKRGANPSANMAPFEGGIQGDLRIGRSGYVYCRYGTFWGELADKGLIYNPKTKGTQKDLRNAVAVPDFVESVPKEIQELG